MLNDRVVPFFEQHDLKTDEDAHGQGKPNTAETGKTHEYELYLGHRGT